jgi:hypothetical protein
MGRHLTPRPEIPLYSLHGLLVESEIQLDARRIAGDSARRHHGDTTGRDQAPAYRIAERKPRDVPYRPPPGRVVGGFPVLGYWVSESADAGSRWTVRYTGLCDAIIDRKRRSIEIHRSLRCDPELLPLIVGGSVLAHALVAEGRLVLQASALEIDGRALAIAGRPRAGKSTLAALLCATGARLLSDDALRVDPSGGNSVCFPGTNAIRLTPNAAALGERIDGADLRPTVDGRITVVPPGAAESPMEVASVLIPTPTDVTRELEVERLRGADALVELMRYPRIGGWRAREQVRRLFELSAELADSVAVFRATVPWGPPFQSGLATRLLSAVGLGATDDTEGAAG